MTRPAATTRFTEEEATREHPHVATRRVLVVEDDPDILDALTFALGGDFDVTAANSGLVAMSLLEREPFDLIVLDLYLPGVDGEAILSALRAKDIRTPVVLASASRDIEATALTFGALGFLKKPFSLLQVESMVARFEARAREPDVGGPAKAVPGRTLVTSQTPTVPPPKARGSRPSGGKLESSSKLDIAEEVATSTNDPRRDAD